MSDALDTVFSTVRRWAGSCAAVAGAEELKATLEQGERVMYAPQFLQVISTSQIDLSSVTEGFGAVKETIETVENVCLDLKAVTDIHLAVKDMINDEKMKDTAFAAQAFANLFSGVGRLARHMPSPAKEWSEFLQQCGVLFINIEKANNPKTGYRWKQLRQMDGMESLWKY